MDKYIGILKNCHNCGGMEDPRRISCRSCNYQMGRHTGWHACASLKKEVAGRAGRKCLNIVKDAQGGC